ncbi:MAG: beta-lactamase family protein [Actinomycetota bacterium]|nr:MAG: beta-lactamase family protein [Actinomycetota bacterium]
MRRFVVFGAALLMTACGSGAVGSTASLVPSTAAATPTSTAPASAATSTTTTRPPTTTTGARATSTTAASTTAVATSTTSAPSTSTPAPATSTPSSSSTPSTSSTSATGVGDPYAAFDEVVREATVGAGARAVSVALARDGVVVHAMAAGTADPSDGEQATVFSRFRIASISKVLTSVVVLQLVEEGRLGLDEPVAPYLSAHLGVEPADPRIADVTVRQMLSHTSGFPQAENFYFADSSTIACPDAGRAALGSWLERDPGSHFQYSNTNFCLLGLLIERIVGAPYEEIVRERLAPLGIQSVDLVGTYETPDGGAVHPARPGRSFMEALGAAGAWTSTAYDLALLMSAIDPTTALPHPLDRATVAAMRTPVPAIAPGSDWTYGLGLRLWSDGSWGHTGTIEQVRAITLVRADGWTAALLVSGERPRSDELRAIVAYGLVAAGLA